MTEIIATLTIAVGDRKAVSDKVNHLLSEYGELVIARMGLPLKDKGISMITIIIRAEEEKVDELNRKLSLVETVKVKTLKV